MAGALTGRMLKICHSIRKQAALKLVQNKWCSQIRWKEALSPISGWLFGQFSCFPDSVHMIQGHEQLKQNCMVRSLNLGGKHHVETGWILIGSGTWCEAHSLPSLLSSACWHHFLRVWSRWLKMIASWRAPSRLIPPSFCITKRLFSLPSFCTSNPMAGWVMCASLDLWQKERPPSPTTVRLLEWKTVSSPKQKLVFLKEN